MCSEVGGVDARQAGSDRAAGVDAEQMCSEVGGVDARQAGSDRAEGADARQAGSVCAEGADALSHSFTLYLSKPSVDHLAGQENGWVVAPAFKAWKSSQPASPQGNPHCLCSVQDRRRSF